MELSNINFTPAVTPIRIGIDVGSTTVKIVCLDENDKMLRSLKDIILSFFVSVAKLH